MPCNATGLMALLLMSVVGMGCTANGELASGRLFGWEKVKTPRDPNLPLAHLETSERVESLGRRLIAQNAFTGIEPLFYTFGVPESVLFHRGAEELFISEGLVKKCKTEDELAAVLCSELGVMMAEKRGARRSGADKDTIPAAGLAGGVSVAGGTPLDPGREAEIAFRERQQPKSVPVADTADANKYAKELLKGAGFDATELERIEPLLKQSSRSAALRKQMSGSAPAPKWDK